MKSSVVIAKNTLHQFVGKFVTMFVTIIVTALITRTYGVEGYGSFNLIISFPAIFYIIADFGFNAIATRELSKNESKMGEYLGNIFILRVIISIILTVITFILLFFLPYSVFLKVGIMLSTLTILTTTLFSTANIGFQVKLRYDMSRTALTIGSLAAFIWILVFAYFQSNIIVLSLGYVFAGVVNVVLGFYLLKKLGIVPKLKFNSELAKKLTLSSIPLGLMFIFSQINFKTDSILLSFLPLPSTLGLNNLETVGIYGLAYKIFEVSLIVPTFFMNSVYPIMVQKNELGITSLAKIFKKALASLLILGICCGIGGYFFSDLAISILGGDSFIYSSQILRILLGGIFIFYLSQPVAWFIVTLNGEKYLPLIYLAAAALNLSLNIIFIPHYSVFASAHITWISELFILVLLSIVAFSLYRTAKKPA